MHLPHTNDKNDSNDFYSQLKQQWQLEKEELQASRKEVDQKRKEFYTKYYELKIGIEDVEGTRPKQNSERKEARAAVDAAKSRDRVVYDRSVESWSAYNERIAALRKPLSEKAKTELATKFAELEKSWIGYKATVEKFHTEYAPALEKSRPAQDDAAYKGRNSYNKNSTDALHDRIKQDRALANYTLADWEKQLEAFFKQREKSYIKLHKDLKTARIVYASYVAYYNNNYFADKSAKRKQWDLQRHDADKSLNDWLAKERTEGNVWLRSLWPTYRKERAEMLTSAVANFFALVRESTNSTIRNVKSFKQFGVAILEHYPEIFINAANNHLSIFNSVNKASTGLVNGVIKEIKTFGQATIHSNRETLAGSPEQRAAINAEYSNYIDSINAELIAAKTTPPEIIDTYAALDAEEELPDDEAATLQGRTKFYDDYDQYIKLFFNTRTEQREKLFQERQAERVAADKDLNTQWQKNIDSKAEERTRYRTEIAAQRELKRAEYDRQINILESRINDPKAKGYARNKRRGQEMGEIKDAILDKFASIFVWLEDGITNIHLLPIVAAKGIVRSMVDFASWTSYKLGSGAYYVHIIDRHVLRPVGYQLLDLGYEAFNEFKKFCRFIAPLPYYLIQNLMSLGWKAFANMRYGIKRLAAEFSLYSRLFLSTIAPALAIAIIHAFKIVYYPFLIISGVVLGLGLRVLQLAAHAVDLAISTVELTANTLFGIVGLILFPITLTVDILIKLTLATAYVALLAACTIGSDISAAAFIALTSLAVFTGRRVADIALITSKVIFNTTIVAGRIIRDVSHLLKVALFDNVAYPIGKTITNLSIGAMHIIGTGMYKAEYKLSKYSFKLFVAFSALMLTLKHGLGRMAMDTSYYGGKVVNKIARAANDTAESVGYNVNVNTIPARENLHKAALCAKETLKKVPNNVCNAAEDYIVHPVTYVYQQGAVQAGRTVYDKSVDAWRGTQDICTAGVRNMHDLKHEAVKHTGDKAIAVQRSIYDNGSNAKHRATLSAYRAFEALQKCNPASCLEHSANKYLDELAKENGNNSEPRP